MLDRWREYKDRVGGEELVWGGVRVDGGAGEKPTSNSQVAATFWSSVAEGAETDTPPNPNPTHYCTSIPNPQSFP